MEFISLEFYKATVPVECDAWKCFDKAWTKRMPIKDHLLDVRDLICVIHMLRRKGYIIVGETFIEYGFMLEGEMHYLNAHPEIDRICRKYDIYSKTLEMPDVDPALFPKFPYTLKHQRLWV